MTVASYSTSLKANKKAAEAHAIDSASSPSAHSTTTESFSVVSNRISSPEVEEDVPNMYLSQQQQVRTTADVQDWIAKARESIQAFDGYIDMVGPGVRASDLLEDADGEGKDGDGLEFDEDEDDGMSARSSHGSRAPLSDFDASEMDRYFRARDDLIPRYPNLHPSHVRRRVPHQS